MATKLHSTLTGSDLHVNKIDGTTGTELTTPSETIYDARWVRRTGSSITVPSSGNVTALAVTQNDTANNPRGIDLTNAGTGIGMNIGQTGNGQAFVISDSGTSTSYTVNKNNTGTAFRVTRNQSNGLAAMAIFTQSHASDPQDLFQVNNAGTGRSFMATDSGTGTTFLISKNAAGTAFSITRNQSNGVSALAKITQSHASDPQDAFQITNAGTGSALLINTNDLSVKSGNSGIGVVTANSKLQVAGPIATALSTKTGAYTLTATDSTILADGTGGAFTVTLPTAASITGRIYTIKRINAGGNDITVGTTSSQTIDGATTKTLGSQFASIQVQSDGSNWVILSQMGTVT